jgi:hypothetical protein
VSAHAKRVSRRDFFEKLGDGLVLKFDQFSAHAANEVIVLRIPVIVLVNFTPVGPRDAS